MARRSDNQRVRLEIPAELLAERKRAQDMVIQFERKGIYNTIWHDVLKRVNARIKDLEQKGEVTNG